jgi:hypothetical protein
MLDAGCLHPEVTLRVPFILFSLSSEGSKENRKRTVFFV